MFRYVVDVVDVVANVVISGRYNIDQNGSLFIISRRLYYLLVLVQKLSHWKPLSSQRRRQQQQHQQIYYVSVNYMKPAIGIGIKIKTINNISRQFLLFLFFQKLCAYLLLLLSRDEHKNSPIDWRTNGQIQVTYNK